MDRRCLGLKELLPASSMEAEEDLVLLYLGLGI